MGAAFTGGPYYSSLFLAATEQIMVEALADCLTHAGWLMVDKVSAWASARPIPPTDGLAVLVDGNTFTFKTTPSALRDVGIGSSLDDSISNFVAAVNAHSATCSASYDSSGLVIVVEYRTGGSSGNGTALSGWLDWTSDYDAPHDALWLGGYKFQSTGSSAGLPVIPCVVYVFQRHVFNWSEGYSAPVVQFMSQDQAIKGVVRPIASGSASSMHFIGGPAQFFLFRTDVVKDVGGSIVCGGSFYTNYDAEDPLANAWWSMGDGFGDNTDWSSTPRTSYCNGFAYASPQRFSESCRGTSYAGPVIANSATQLTLRMTPGDPGYFSGIHQAHRRYGGDPIISEPFLIANGRYLGQLYDSLTVGLAFPTGYDGVSLATAYPWMDGSTRPDGVPRNRLSGDFDQGVWENITDNYVYGGLFVMSAIPSFMKGKFNYVYEGKA